LIGVVPAFQPGGVKIAAPPPLFDRLTAYGFCPMLQTFFVLVWRRQPPVLAAGQLLHRIDRTMKIFTKSFENQEVGLKGLVAFSAAGYAGSGSAAMILAALLAISKQNRYVNSQSLAVPHKFDSQVT
jgi:hypothetical protein